MGNHWKVVSLLTVVCLLGISRLVYAVSIGVVIDQTSAAAPMPLENTDVAVKKLPASFDSNSFMPQDGISGRPVPNRGREFLMSSKFSDPNRATVIPIPTTWDDVTVMLIPTQWDDMKIIFVSPNKVKKIGKQSY